MIDASALYSTTDFDSAVDDLYSEWLSSDETATAFLASGLLFSVPTPVLGQHYFITSPSGTGISPKWDFTADGDAFEADAAAYVIGAKTGSTNAPNAARDVAWLYLTSVQGSLASTVYRIQTRGGQPPAACTPGSADISVKYSSQYCASLFLFFESKRGTNPGLTHRALRLLGLKRCLSCHAWTARVILIGPKLHNIPS